MAKKKFEVNFQDLFEVDVTPDAATRNYERLGAGISSLTPSTNENVDQSAYLDGNGYGSSSVTSAQLTFSVSGHRVLGDPAQDYIVSKEFELGDERETNFRFFDSRGTERRGPCTLANLQVGGGDAQGKKEISFEIHLNGKPEKIDPVDAPELTTIFAAGSKAGTVKGTVTIVEAENKLAYRVTSASFEVMKNSYHAGASNYTSGNDIIASAGQFVTIFELNKYDRVVKSKTIAFESIA